MKPIIIIFLLLIPFFGFSQAALHRPDSVESQTFLRYTMSNFSMPTSGQNQIWDFQNILLGENPSLIRLVAHTSEDTIFITHTDGQTVYYNFLYDNQLLQIRYEKNHMRISHASPRILLEYPLHFQQSFNSRFDGALYRALSPRLLIKSQSSVKLIGHGSLILPNEDTVSNVFLVRTQVGHGQTEQEILEDFQTIYAFYISNSVVPIIEIFHQTHQAYYYDFERIQTPFDPDLDPDYDPDYDPDEMPPSVPEDTELTLSTSIAPNPTTDKAVVTLELPTPTTVFWEIHTLQGIQVGAGRWEFPTGGVHRRNLYLGEYNLPSGMYLITFRIDGIIKAHRIQKL
ncbi:MAG: T9SS type A sorting domain-containing protein [Bacteroidales bacterium]|nr:T9SS type A sorting domain-containing protein [Bacteroidales bacterium]